MGDENLGRAVLALSTDDKDLDSGLSGAEGKANSWVARVGGTLGKGLAVGAGVAIAAGAALTAVLGDSLKGAIDAENIQADLAATLKSTGGAAGMTADSVNALAGALQAATPFEDDVIVKGENMLLTFTNIGKDVFPQATEAMLNMAQKMGGDLQGAAIQLGKALNDPTAGVSALTRVGVTFTDQQKEQIKAMQAAGDTAGAQKLILAELEKEFGGVARAAGGTFGGQMTILQNQINGVKDEVGTALIPVLAELATKYGPGVVEAVKAIGQWMTTSLIPAIQTAAEWLGTNLPPAIKTVSDLWTGTLKPAIETVANFVTTSLIPALQDIGAWLGTHVPAAVKTLTDLWTGTLQPAFQTASGYVTGTLVPAFQGIGTALAGPQQALATVGALPLWTQLSQVFGPAVERLRDAFAGFSDKLAPLQAALGPLWEAIKPVAEVIGVTVGAGLVGAVYLLINGLGALLENLGTVATGLTVTLTGAVNAVVVPIQTMVAVVKQLLEGDWKGAWDAAQTGAGAFRDALGTIASGIGTTIDGMAGAVWDALSGLASDITGKNLPKWDTFKAGVVGKVGEMATSVGTTIATLETTISSTVTRIHDGAVASFNGMRDSIVASFDGIIKGIKEKLNAVIDIMNTAIGAFNKLPGPDMPTIPRLAAGVRNFAGGWAIVGENGPEPVYLPAGADVYPHRELAGMLGGDTYYIDARGSSLSEAQIRQQFEYALAAVGRSADARSRLR